MFLYLVQARAPSALLCTQNATPVFYNVLCICLSRACLGKPMAFLALNIGSENGAENGAEKGDEVRKTRVIFIYILTNSVATDIYSN